MDFSVPLLLAVLAAIGTAMALGGLVYFLQRRLHLVRLLAFPLYLAAIATGLRVLAFLQEGQVPWSDETVYWFLIFLGAVTLLRLIGVYVFRVYLENRRRVRLPSLLPAVVMGASYLVAGLVIYSLAFPDSDLTPLLATSAITSLVLGLALQPILGNFFAGLVISFEKPFRINDWIRLGDHEGRVVAMTWRTTHVRNRDNDNVILPNSRIAEEELINYHYPNPLHLERIYVGVHYRTAPYRVKEALLKAASRVPGVLEKPTPEVFVVSFDDSSIRYELRVWLEDFSLKPKIASTVHSEIWEEFKRRKITIPFPIRTLEIEPLARTVEIARAKRDGRPEAAVPPARLFVSQGADRGSSLELDGAAVTIGRSHSCDLVLLEGQASKEHLRIEWNQGRYIMTDLDSHNGTSVNGSKTKSQALHDLDRIQVGETEIVFETHVS